jgi:hypothetical protein
MRGDYTRIIPALTGVPLKLREILHKPGERIQSIPPTPSWRLWMRPRQRELVACAVRE